MISKYLKKCISSLATRKMQIKTTSRFQFNSISISNTTDKKCLVRLWLKRNPHSLLEERQIDSATLEVNIEKYQKQKCGPAL